MGGKEMVLIVGAYMLDLVECNYGDKIDLLRVGVIEALFVHSL